MIFNLIYKFFTFLYSLFFSIVEEIFLKKNNNFLKKPIYRFKNITIEDIIYKHFDHIKINKYLSKVIFPENKILEIIDNLFCKNKLANEITNLIGYNYTISFFTAYTTYKISQEDINLQWYANKFHVDKPFSKNMIKLFFSFEEINENDGPMLIKDNFLYKATIQKNEVILLLPTQYYHKATSPINGSRFQIMLQLNPSKKWKINKNIYFKQKKIEPKFPFFSYLFDKKINLKLN